MEIATFLHGKYIEIAQLPEILTAFPATKERAIARTDNASITLIWYALRELPAATPTDNISLKEPDALPIIPGEHASLTGTQPAIARKA